MRSMRPRLVLLRATTCLNRPLSWVQIDLQERGLAPAPSRTHGGRKATGIWSCRCGLLSPELAAGIHRVKGVRKLGSRLGNWLTAVKPRSLAASRQRRSHREAQSSYIGDFARLWPEAPGTC